MSPSVRKSPAEAPLVAISRRVARRAAARDYAPPAAYVYNPVEYAREAHEQYLTRFGVAPGRVLLMGMNPGPWGMAQTGVPFGDIESVRQWMGIEGVVKQPRAMHPRVPIMGFACHRREGSGKRLWGWAAGRGSADLFFRRFFVWNYAPLCFLAEGGANLTPEKLCREDREHLIEVCNQGLREVIEALRPRLLVGIGNFAATRLREVAGEEAEILRLLHPSPANPRANREWDSEADRVLGPYL